MVAYGCSECPYGHGWTYVIRGGNNFVIRGAQPILQGSFPGDFLVFRVFFGGLARCSGTISWYFESFWVILECCWNNSEDNRGSNKGPKCKRRGWQRPATGAHLPEGWNGIFFIRGRKNLGKTLISTSSFEKKLWIAFWDLARHLMPCLNVPQSPQLTVEFLCHF